MNTSEIGLTQTSINKSAMDFSNKFNVNVSSLTVFPPINDCYIQISPNNNYIAFVQNYSLEIFTKENMIFEMHYTTIFDWKRIVPDIKTIYILPNDIEIAKQKTKERGLTKEKEEERIAEIEEHYDRFMSDQNLQKSFDYIVYNKYDKESEENIINLVKRITEKN